MKLEQLYPFDIETYPNLLSMVITNMATKEVRVFEISNRKDERKEMIEYLRDIVRNKGYMVGFNSVGFDYPVIHFLLKNQNASVKQIYQKAQSIIDSDDRFANVIWDNDTLIPQIDLFKIHHFDNKARMTSLKMLEFNMRMDNIEELPYEPGTVLTSEQIDHLLEYNKHDVKATMMFLEQSMDQIEFREKLTEATGKNCMNFNDTKIGKDHFVTELEKANKGCCYLYNGRKRSIRQTKRPKIDLKDCIFPYVKFDRPEFQAILDWLCQQTITETKGVFSDILEDKLGDVAKYANMVTKRQKKPTKPSDAKIDEYRKKHPMGWLSEEPLKSGKVSYWWNWNVAESLNVVINGLEYVFGTGGIHASIESQTVYTDDKYIIVDQDVASYYPNLAIKNRVYPEHLGELFCDLYEGMYNERKKHGKGTTENAMLKLALNGSYGASNDQYSPLYDPMFTMKITINGQLSLCMLAEKLLEIDGLSLIQLNTDGLTYRCKRKDDQRAQNICDDWCSLTKLDLERADYRQMTIRDVNNYVSVYMNGKTKCKGAYQYEELGWHQNHSALIIARAAFERITKGVPIEDTIKNHTDYFDFMYRTKVPRSSRLIGIDEHGFEDQLQRITRYYVSKEGVELVKIMPPLENKKIIETTWRKPENGEELVTTKKPTRKGFTEIVKQVELPPEERRIGIQSGQKVKVCNDITKFNKETIDYDYYVSEANKLVEGLI